MERTKPLSTLSLVSPIRQSLEFQLELSNPSDSPAEYQVTLEGEFVSGEESFTLGPKEQGVYKVLFRPFREMEGNG